MNERIRELCAQARVYADELLGQGLPDTVWQDWYHEKLVHLVVWECADYIQHFYGDIAASSIGNDIKLHFGIEE